MKQLTGKNLLLVGFTLFSMFFGAGNLIFPPGIAAQAGTMTWPAMAGMAISAVGFPVLGIIAVIRSGGLTELGSRVHPVFAVVFTVLAYLSIGPCLAIPRTASTSFSMLLPLLGGVKAETWVLQLIYSLVFFAVALAVALRPEKLTQRLGKITFPALILLIVITFVACLINPLNGYGQPSGAYTAHVVSQGFLDGYQTMDTIAALVFGMVIALNIRNLGVSEEKEVVRGTVRAGWIAGALLLVVYCMVAHVGAISGGYMPGATDGAQVLTNVVGVLFGPVGNVLLAAIFILACFNVCVGLVSSCAEYFSVLVPKFSYRAWAVFFALVSMVISNAGLSAILNVSVPILSAIYPVAIMLITLSFFHKWLEARPEVYAMGILFTGVASVLYAVNDALGKPMAVLASMPLAEQGLAWILPGVLGVLLGLLVRGRGKRA